MRWLAPRFSVAFTGLLLVLAGFAWMRTPNVAAVPPQDQNAKGVPVVVELFTSEGCSSCPPADRLLAQLDAEQPVAGAEIIALGWHVDYWNHLGWKDRFSSADFTERQYRYSQKLGTSGVYTPQMVVDGRTEFVGSDAALARRVIARAAVRLKIHIGIAERDAGNQTAGENVSLAIRIVSSTVLGKHEPADVWLAVTENGLNSQVTRGENAGRQLAHRAVVRRFERLGEFPSERAAWEAHVSLKKDWSREQLRAVAFVQEKKSGRILGAGSIPLFAR